MYLFFKWIMCPVGFVIGVCWVAIGIKKTRERDGIKFKMSHLFKRYEMEQSSGALIILEGLTLTIMSIFIFLLF